MQQHLTHRTRDLQGPRRLVIPAGEHGLQDGDPSAGRRQAGDHVQGRRGPRVPKGEPHPDLLVCLYLIQIPELHSQQQGSRPDHKGAWGNRGYVHLFGYQVDHNRFGEIGLRGVIRHCQKCLDFRYGCGCRRILEIPDPKHRVLYARRGHIQLHHYAGPVYRAIFYSDASCV